MTALRKVVVTAALLVTACGTPPQEPGKPTPTLPTPGIGEVTVEGVVQEGVEAGCVLLDTATVDYLLIGGDRALLQRGRPVGVRGTPKPMTPSICQQGVPLEVHDAWPR